MQNSSSGHNAPSWALDDIYIGEKCPDMCSGHGTCTRGAECQCDPGYIGKMKSCLKITGGWEKYQK